MAKKRGLVKPSDIRKKIEELSRKPALPEPQVKEAVQSFTVSKFLKTHKVNIIGSDVRIPLTTGVASSLREVGRRLDKITGQKRKKNKPRKTAEIDVWAMTDLPEGRMHLLLELKNLPKNENVSTLSKYYKYGVEVVKLLKKHPYLLGTADTRSFPIGGLGKKIRVPVERWMEADKLMYVLVTNRSPTRKEWERLERLKQETGQHILVVRDYELGKLVNYLRKGRTSGRFAGKTQKIVVHSFTPEGPLDKFLKDDKNRK